jgi:hypothetical protein
MSIRAVIYLDEEETESLAIPFDKIKGSKLLNIKTDSIEDLRILYRILHHTDDPFMFEIDDLNKRLHNLHKLQSGLQLEYPPLSAFEEVLNNAQWNAKQFVKILFTLALVKSPSVKQLLNLIDGCHKLSSIPKRYECHCPNDWIQRMIALSVDIVKIMDWYLDRDTKSLDYIAPVIVAIDRYLATIYQFRPYNYKCKLIHSQDNNYSKYLSAFAGDGWSIFTNSNWPDGLVLAGGACTSCLFNRNLNDLEKSEDLDFWVVGDSPTQRLNTFMKAFSLLSSEHSGPVVYSINGSVITIVISGKSNRQVQLIYTEYWTPDELVTNFDLPHVRSYYDGKNMYITREVDLMLKGRFISIDMDMRTERMVKMLRYPMVGLSFDSEVDQTVYTKFQELSQIHKFISRTGLSRKVFEEIDPEQAAIQYNKYVRFDDDIDEDRMLFETKAILKPEIVTASADKVLKHINNISKYENGVRGSQMEGYLNRKNGKRSIDSDFESESECPVASTSSSAASTSAPISVPVFDCVGTPMDLKLKSDKDGKCEESFEGSSKCPGKVKENSDTVDVKKASQHWMKSEELIASNSDGQESRSSVINMNGSLESIVDEVLKRIDCSTFELLDHTETLCFGQPLVLHFKEFPLDNYRMENDSHVSHLLIDSKFEEKVKVINGLLRDFLELNHKRFAKNYFSGSSLRLSIAAHHINDTADVNTIDFDFHIDGWSNNIRPFRLKFLTRITNLTRNLK